MNYQNFTAKNKRFYPLLIIGLWLFVCGFVMISSPGSLYAEKVTLAWDKSDGAAGYKIYSGTSSNSYSWVIDVGNVTTYTTGELTEGYTYYFAATSYDTLREESDFSEEVSYNTDNNQSQDQPQSYYTITASAGTGGSISPSGTVSVASGSSRTFTITPNSGYRISNVVVNGSSVGAVSSYTFSNITRNNTISATFTVSTTSYTITASAGTGGSISPSGTVSVASGSSRTFTITPNSGYRISNVVVNGSSVGAVSSYTFSNITRNNTISATFTVSTTSYTITASAGTGGTISPSGTVKVASGSSRTFTITPNSGYKISNVLVNGSSVGAVNSYTFSNINRNSTISATFTASTTFYTITASAGVGGSMSGSAGGSISPSGSVTVAAGSSVVFYITPDSQHIIREVLVNNAIQGAISSYKFSNVTANATIQVFFDAWQSW